MKRFTIITALVLTACVPSPPVPKFYTIELPEHRKAVSVYCVVDCDARKEIWVLTRPARVGELPEALELQPFDQYGRGGVAIDIQEK